MHAAPLGRLAKQSIHNNAVILCVAKGILDPRLKATRQKGGKKTAFLIDKKASAEKINETFSKAASLRANGECVTVSAMKKNKRFQKEQLEKEGYPEFKEFFVEAR